MKNTVMDFCVRNLLVGGALLALACGDEKSGASGTTGQGGETSGTSTTEAATGGTSTTATGTMGEEPTSSGSGTTATFIMGMDMSGGAKQCDQWAQDCPEGQKCMPYSGDGDNSWESLKCVPVAPNPGAIGDDCTAEGGVSGIDDCDKGLMCWNVDPVTNVGVCVAMCVGSEQSPQCEIAMTTCLISNGGVLTLCLPSCDPLVQDCPGEDVCIPNPQDPNGFLCLLDASGDEGQDFDPCQYINACDKGFFCAVPSLASECDPMAIGCCLPFCDLSAMAMCAGMGQECIPWFAMGMAPPGYEEVGFCGIPQ